MFDDILVFPYSVCSIYPVVWIKGPMFDDILQLQSMTNIKTNRPVRTFQLVCIKFSCWKAFLPRDLCFEPPVATVAVLKQFLSRDFSSTNCDMALPHGVLHYRPTQHACDFCI